MATKTRRRTAQPKLGKEAWQIVTPGGALVRESGHGETATLALAQTLALNAEGDQVEYVVRWKALFGDPQELYRVARDECGVVTTTPA